MQKSKKINVLLIIILISMFIVFPNLLLSIQKNIEVPINEKSPNEIINTRPPQESYVYYEDTDGIARSVYVSGNYAYVADTELGLAVIDISDPTNPGPPVYENTNGDARGVYVSGDYVYLADYNSGLEVIDISNPTNPGTSVCENTTGAAFDVFVSGNYAYIADFNSGLAVIDISDPTNPGTPVYEDTSGHARAVYVSGDFAYVADGSSGLAVIDISDPTNPGKPVYEDTIGYAEGVYVSGDYAYIADETSGLAIIDISHPTNPGSPVYEATDGNAGGVYVSGDYAYVADGLEGLAVINISDPTNPGTPVYENTTGHACDIIVSGDYAYVADGYSGLAVINISDPTNPGTPVYANTNGYASGVYVSGDYAYVADGYWGLAVINISDPTNPEMITYEDTTDSAEGIYVSGDYAYVADYTSGLAVIDISDPTNPVTVNYADTSEIARSVYVSGDYAYVANSVSGLAVIDITDPTNPGSPVYANTDGYARDVCVSGDYAYVADHSSGLAVINISDPTDPGTPIYANTDGYAYGVYVSGYYAYIADWTSGLAIIQIRKGIDMEDPIISNAPNDFTIELGYSGQNISWTATDDNPDSYTIELQGMGIVEGPTLWTSGNTINYNITEGYGVGSYVYIVYFTDDYGNFITDSVVVTVEDTTNPVITVSPNNFTVEQGYTGQSISWTATDANPGTYTIQLIGTGIVVSSTPWFNNTPVVYNILDEYGVGSYVYTVNFTDDYGNFISDSVNFTVVEDTTNPVITVSPDDFIVEHGYTGQSISWTATDDNPDSYTVALQGTGIVAGPISWTSGVIITYYIPVDFGLGIYTYSVNFTDEYGNSITDIIVFTVVDTTNPALTSTPGDLMLEAGDVGLSLSWTATDAFPDYYEIELQGSGVIAGALAWTSGVAITYNIPDNLDAGVYVYTVTFTDEYNNFISDTVTVTINSSGTTPPAPGTVPFGNFFLIFIGLSVIGLIFAKKRQMHHKAR